MTPLKKLHQDYQNLSEEDKQAFIAEIFAQSTGQAEVSSIKEEIHQVRNRHCPHCSSHSIVANGRNKGVQRFRCKECGKNFSENTGTSIANLKKGHLWKNYIRHMFEGHSIYKCAKLTGISIQTSFDWRHKVLSSLQSLSPEGFDGISESDDIFFNYSQKGSKSLTRAPRKRGNDGIRQGVSGDKVAVILTCDRNKRKDLKVAKRGRIRKADLVEALSGKFGSETVLCTDSHRSYTAFAKQEGLTHQKIHARKKQYVKDRIYHTQNVNQTTRALKDWMNKFNGVATKYLQNYLAWFMVIEQLKGKKNQLKEFAVAALVSTHALNIFKSLKVIHI